MNIIVESGENKIHYARSIYTWCEFSKLLLCQGLNKFRGQSLQEGRKSAHPVSVQSPIMTTGSTFIPDLGGRIVTQKIYEWLLITRGCPLFLTCTVPIWHLAQLGMVTDWNCITNVT